MLLMISLYTSAEYAGLYQRYPPGDPPGHGRRCGDRRSTAIHGFDRARANEAIGRFR